MSTVEPVSHAVQEHQLPFRFGIRFNMAVWNAINFTARTFQPDPKRPAEWNRSAYLVDALGHCGACHSPKTFLGTDDRAAYLKGGLLQGWFAPDITGNRRTGIGSRSDDELVRYLKTGSNSFSVASGPMSEEITNSSSKMPDSDLKAIATYLKSLDGGNSEQIASVLTTDPQMVSGKAVYLDNCSSCHVSSGKGQPHLFPARATSGVVKSSDATTLIRVVLQGTRGVTTSAAPTGPAMPSFAWKLSDEHMAAVLTYIRNDWGNAASAIASSGVGALRGSLASAR